VFRVCGGARGPCWGRPRWRALAGSGVAHAQQAADPNQPVDIVVTATKRSERLQDVPLSIQALGNTELDQRQVQSFDDYAKLLPSVSFQSFGPSQSQIYFRGVTSGGDGLHGGSAPASGLYLDEVPLTTIANNVDFHVYDIERVERCRGRKARFTAPVRFQARFA
jgi:outer membrane receptor protein involved in Fe transport